MGLTIILEDYSECVAWVTISQWSITEQETGLEGKGLMAYEYLVLIPQLLSLILKEFLEAYIFIHGKVTIILSDKSW